jgi:hypothetical protein
LKFKQNKHEFRNSIRDISERRLLMSGVSRSTLVVGIAVVIFAMLGCSSDDDSVTNVPAKTEGDEYNLNYLLFKGEVFDCKRQYVYRIEELLKLGFGQSKERVLVYHPSSQYWYGEDVDTSYYGIETSYDSVQFLHSGTPVENPDSSLLTEIKGGSHWVLVDTSFEKSGYSTAPGDTHFVVHMTCDVTGEPGEIAGAGNVSISFDATSSGLTPSVSSDCDWNCDITASADDLPMNITDDNCPTSGVIDFVASMVMICPSPLPSYSNSWEATETYSDGAVSWRIENESHYWNADGTCTWYIDY